MIITLMVLTLSNAQPYSPNSNRHLELFLSYGDKLVERKDIACKKEKIAPPFPDYPFVCKVYCVKGEKNKCFNVDTKIFNIKESYSSNSLDKSILENIKKPLYVEDLYYKLYNIKYKLTCNNNYPTLIDTVELSEMKKATCDVYCGADARGNNTQCFNKYDLPPIKYKYGLDRCDTNKPCLTW